MVACCLLVLAAWCAPLPRSRRTPGSPNPHWARVMDGLSLCSATIRRRNAVPKKGSEGSYRDSTAIQVPCQPLRPPPWGQRVCFGRFVACAVCSRDQYIVTSPMTPHAIEGQARLLQLSSGSLRPPSCTLLSSSFLFPPTNYSSSLRLNLRGPVPDPQSQTQPRYIRLASF